MLLYRQIQRKIGDILKAPSLDHNVKKILRLATSNLLNCAQ